jgi:inorganic pyrophosphatase
LCAFIEITPFDLVKYEVDKETGYLRVDRPQRTSSLPPTLYGFVPKTWCGPRVAALMPGADAGDHDPLDICVLSERPIDRAEVVLSVRVVGGLPMLDGGEADDKIVAVLESDGLYEGVHDIDQLPAVLVNRLLHYFEFYKVMPGVESTVRIGDPYGRRHAERVVAAALLDYADAYGDAGDV